MRLPDLSVYAGETHLLIDRRAGTRAVALATLGLALAPVRHRRFLLRPGRGARQRATDVGHAWSTADDARLSGCRREIGRVGAAHDPHAFPAFLGAGANIDLPRRLLGLPVDERETERRMRRAGLAIDYGARVDALPLPDRRRLEILRAFAHRPALVLADDPGVGLTETEARRILDVLRVEADESGAALVLAAGERAATLRFPVEAAHALDGG